MQDKDRTPLTLAACHQFGDLQNDQDLGAETRQQMLNRLSKCVEPLAERSTESHSCNLDTGLPVPIDGRHNFDTQGTGCRRRTKSSNCAVPAAAEAQLLPAHALGRNNSVPLYMKSRCRLVSTEPAFDWAVKAISLSIEQKLGLLRSHPER